MTAHPTIHVAVGVLRDAQGRVLIAKRPDHVHQGGLWEFPGGKVEPGESVTVALRRELREELGVCVRAERPLIQVRHAYPGRAVLLDVFHVDEFDGEPHGREGQPVAWVETERLHHRAFPAANRPILTAARLPDRYLITPPPGEDENAFLETLEQSLGNGVRLAQLRAPGWDHRRLEPLARKAQAICARHGARLLANADPAQVMAWGLDGAHLNGRRLMALDERPAPASLLLGASCHNPAELTQAQALGADFCVLGPVRATPSHPGVAGMGWAQFQALAATTTMPVYALGGLGLEDRDIAWRHGAQGIAGISRLWSRR